MMNPNGTHDRERLEQVERLLENGRLTGNPVLDEMAQTVPQPHPMFQRDLEDKLMAQFQSQTTAEGDENMTTLTQPFENPARRFSTPLTLAAALLAMMLVGSILMSVGGRSSNPGLSVAALTTETPTLTPTPTPQSPVETVSPILRSGCASNDVGFMEQQLTVLDAQIAQLQSQQSDQIAAGANLTSPSAIAQNQDDLRTTAAALLQTQQLRETLTQAISGCGANSTGVSVGPLFAGPFIGIPPEQTTIAIPRSAIKVVQGSIVVGDYVDVLAGILFCDQDAVFQTDTQPITQPPACGTAVAPNFVVNRLVQNALVVYPGTSSASASTPPPTANPSDSDVITLAVTPEEKVVLQWAVEAKLSLTLVRVSPPSDLKPVVIAWKSLPSGTQITADAVTVVYWPADLVVDPSSSDPSALVGKYVSRDFKEGQPITNNDVTDQPGQAGSGLPDDRVAVSIPINLIQSVAYAIQDGDHVDVIAGMLVYNTSSPDAQSQMNLLLTPPPSGTPAAPHLSMSRIVQNALVLHVGGFPAGSSVDPTPLGPSDPSNSAVITLSVTPQEAVVLSWAVNAKMTLTLANTAQPTFLPAAPDLQPVVIARQFLPRGTKITADLLTIAYWPAALVPAGAYADSASIVGKYISDNLESGQPVISANVTDQAVYDGRTTLNGIVGRDILEKAITGIPADLRDGDRVDLTVSFLYEHWSDSAREPVNTTVPPDGYVVQKTVLKGLYVANSHFVPNSSPDNIGISVYWSFADIAVFEAILDSNRPIAVTLTRSGDPGVDLQVQNLPDGKVSVFIPHPDVSGAPTVDTSSTPIQAQIYADMTFFTHMSDPTETDPFQPQTVTQVVTLGAAITQSSADGYRMTIPAEDLPTLQWFVNAGIPLTFVL